MQNSLLKEIELPPLTPKSALVHVAFCHFYSPALNLVDKVFFNSNSL